MIHPIISRRNATEAVMSVVSKYAYGELKTETSVYDVLPKIEEEIDRLNLRIEGDAPAAASVANGKCYRCGLEFDMPTEPERLCVPCGVLGCDGLVELLSGVKKGHFTVVQATRAIKAAVKTRNNL